MLIFACGLKSGVAALILIMDVLQGKDDTTRGYTSLRIATDESKKIDSLWSGYSEPKRNLPLARITVEIQGKEPAYFWQEKSLSARLFLLTTQRGATMLLREEWY